MYFLTVQYVYVQVLLLYAHTVMNSKNLRRFCGRQPIAAYFTAAHPIMCLLSCDIIQSALEGFIWSDGSST